MKTPRIVSGLIWYVKFYGSWTASFILGLIMLRHWRKKE